jgi:serine O-acetyltransferase
VPGRVVVVRHDETHEHRDAIARKMGFDAYGTTKDMPDPVANAINCMLDHMHVMDQKLEEMCKGLKTMGAELGDMDLPPLGSCQIGDPVPGQDSGGFETPESEQKPGRTNS